MKSQWWVSIPRITDAPRVIAMWDLPAPKTLSFRVVKDLKDIREKRML